MLERKYLREILASSLVAAIVYGVAVCFFFRAMSFGSSWVLYLGNFLFATVIGFFVAWFYRRHIGHVTTIRLVVIGGKATFAGIVMACLISLLLLVIFEPGAFQSRASTTVALKDAPAQFTGKNHGLSTILFINAVLGNMAASFFISLLIPFTIMKNQYSGKGE